MDQIIGLGFRKEGELREHVLKKGQFINKLLFGLLAREYFKMFPRKEMAAVSR